MSKPVETCFFSLLSLLLAEFHATLPVHGRGESSLQGHRDLADRLLTMFILARVRLFQIRWEPTDRGLAVPNRRGLALATFAGWRCGKDRTIALIWESQSVARPFVSPLILIYFFCNFLCYIKDGSLYEIPGENQVGWPPWKQTAFLRNFRRLIWEWPKLVRPDFLPWLVSESSESSQVISSYFFFWRIPRILRRFFASLLWLF